MGRQQNLRPLQLARRLLATAEHRMQLTALSLAQLDMIAYVHRRLFIERGADE